MAAGNVSAGARSLPAERAGARGREQRRGVPALLFPGYEAIRTQSRYCLITSGRWRGGMGSSAPRAAPALHGRMWLHRQGWEQDPAGCCRWYHGGSARHPWCPWGSSRLCSLDRDSKATHWSQAKAPASFTVLPQRCKLKLFSCKIDAVAEALSGVKPSHAQRASGSRHPRTAQLISSPSPGCCFTLENST